jgi:hypothetical protein
MRVYSRYSCVYIIGRADFCSCSSRVELFLDVILEKLAWSVVKTRLAAMLEVIYSLPHSAK